MKLEVHYLNMWEMVALHLVRFEDTVKLKIQVVHLKTKRQLLQKEGDREREGS